MIKRKAQAGNENQLSTKKTQNQNYIRNKHEKKNTQNRKL